MPKPLAVVIFGAGTEGAKLLATLLHVPGIKILAMADRDPSSPGFEAAEAAGVRATRGPVGVSVLRRADVIFDAGGDPTLVGPIRRNTRLHPKLLDGPATQLALRLLTQYRRGQAHMRHAERMTAMGNLLASAAHELNNPLLVVTGYAALAEAHFQAGSVAEVREDIKRMAEAADRLRALTTRFLQFGRPASSSDVPCDVNACVRAVQRMLAHDLSRLEIRLVTSLAPDLPHVLADPRALQEVLVNLVTNARESLAASRRGCEITCETAAGLNESGRYVQIRIGDDGPGIHHVHLPHIFDPLYTTKSPGPNTGMGLAVCYGTVAALGGTITCASMPEQGACFTVRLPAGEPDGTGGHES